MVGAGVTQGSQPNRIYLGNYSTSARANPLDLTELNTWPFELSTQQKADALAVMRAAYPFVPQAA